MATINAVNEPTGASGTVLQGQGIGTASNFSTATYPATTTVSQILYSSATNTVTGLATANNGLLITSTTGVPSILANGTTGQILTATTGSPPSWQPAPSSGIPTIGTSTNNALVSWNGTTGSAVNNTATTIDATNGYIRGPSGAAATPIYSFTGTTGTGMYSSGSNVLNFATNGSSRLSISTVSVTTTLNFNTATSSNNNIFGSLNHSRTTTATDYTTVAGDYLVSVTDTTSARAITLLTPAGGEIRFMIIKDESGGAATHNITISGQSAKTIDGAASLVISTNYGIGRVYYNGTNWNTW